MAGVTRYRIKFDRIGRHRDVADLEVEVENDDSLLDRLAEKVYGYARPKLLSNEVNVVVREAKESGAMTGMIAVGFHDGGRFTVKEVKS